MKKSTLKAFCFAVNHSAKCGLEDRSKCDTWRNWITRSLECCCCYCLC